MKKVEKRIYVKGVKTNNLKNIDVSIPRSQITAVVGVSGAGKTSLAFNTIYAEGYLRYIESISPYIRQFLDKIEKPKIEKIDGLPPALSFRYKKPVKNPRSIVATSLDIFDYLRIIYSKISEFFCPTCGKRIQKYSIDEIMSEIFKMNKKRIDVCFEYSGDISFLINRGYYFHRKRGTKSKIDQSVKQKLIHVLIDSMEVKRQNRSRIFEAIDKSISIGKGNALIFYDNKKHIYPASLFCSKCKKHYPSPDEHLFSFNSPRGACPRCRGFGDIQELDKDLIFDWSLSLSEGAILPLKTSTTRKYRDYLMSKAMKYGIDINKPVKFLREDDINILISGKGEFEGIKGFFDYIRKKSYKVQARVFLSRYTSYRKCEECNGTRFNEIAGSFKIENKNIAEFLAFTTEQAFNFMKKINKNRYRSRISLDVFKEVESRLKYLIDSGLTYIHLNRHTFTLSKGEFQRINLAFILSSTLSDSLLIIDQPSSDLHPFDYEKLKKFLVNLKKNGNTILIIEHARDVVKYSDYILELGPLSGENGGNVVFHGWTEDFFKGKKTITQKYFNKKIELKENKRKFKEWLAFKNASTHNLKNLNLQIPKNTLGV